ncbi:MAG: serine hydrolase [Pseudomonadota bacterium]
MSDNMIRMIQQYFRHLILLLAISLVAACGGSSGSDTAPPSPPTPRASFTYAIPSDVGDGWATADIADEGFDTTIIFNMMDQVVNRDLEGIDSITIVRNEKLVLYWFANRALTEFDEWIGNTDRERHILHSTTKSFTSALAGIAIDQGYIESTQVPFYDLFSYSDYENWDPRKSDMTLEDALTMRFGLEWDEWTLPYSDRNNDLVRLNTTNADWAKALLDLPMNTDPGSSFTYNTAGTNAIGQAVQNAVGMPLEQFANEHLFYPMQIQNADWARTPTSLPIGGSGLFLNGRDLAKFGQLYLANGVWQGQQLISEQWIADSVARRVDITSIAIYSEAYGFQWWIDDFIHKDQSVEVWVTSGYGGQYTFVVPALGLVVAFTGHNYDNFDGVRNLYTMMQSMILASID